MLTPQSLSPTRDIQQQLFQQPDQQPSAYPPVGGRAISPNARRLSLSASGNPRYYSRDVASDPPTPILIVREESDVDANDPHCRFFVLESDVEPTEGWNTRHHKTQLSICFMHSFGKCVGRYQSDPSTCHQVHVRQTVMESLRARYIHPVRRFFSRTIKAHLTPDLLAVVSQVARKDLTLQYLEYLAHDVRETEGLHRYENAYRAWLTAPGGFLHAFHDTSVPQCTDYALRGQCTQERQCPCVHAHLCRAQVRDNIVMNALRIISAPFDHTSGSVSPTGEHDGARRLSPTVSPRYGNSRTTSQSSPNAGMLSGQISPVQFQHQQQHQQPHPHQRMMQMTQAHMNNPQPQPLHHYGNPQQQQVFVHQGPPPHLTMDGPQYMTVSPPNHQLGMQQTSPPTQPVYVVMMPQQNAVSPHHHMHQGGGSGAPSPQQAQLQPGAFQNAFLLPTYQTSLENSGRGAQLMPQQGGVLATGAFDDFQTRLDMGTLSGQTSPHSFISVDAFNQQQRSRSPNPQHSGTGIGVGNTAQPPFALSLNASGSSLWAPQTLTQQQPSPQPQPTTGGGGSVFIPAVYRVDQGSGMLVLEPQGIAK